MGKTALLLVKYSPNCMIWFLVEMIEVMLSMTSKAQLRIRKLIS